MSDPVSLERDLRRAIDLLESTLSYGAVTGSEWGPRIRSFLEEARATLEAAPSPPSKS